MGKYTNSGKSKNPDGVVLYDGPSLIDGERIVAVVTGIMNASSNWKTGPMAQGWILRADTLPTDAVAEGKDVSVCGGCPHRGQGCYVNVGRGPQNVWRSWLAGKYPAFYAPTYLHLFKRKTMRLGAYGDPAAVPFWAWKAAVLRCDAVTGYTRRWKVCDRRWKKHLMASVDTPAQRREAIKLGWRTYRVRTQGEPLLEDEFVCPASEEGGRVEVCFSCRACGGGSPADDPRTPVSFVHCSPAGNFWKAQRWEAAVERVKEAERRRPLPLV